MYTDAEKVMKKDLGPFLSRAVGKGSWGAWKKIKKNYVPKIKC